MKYQRVNMMMNQEPKKLTNLPKGKGYMIK